MSKVSACTWKVLAATNDVPVPQTHRKSKCRSGKSCYKPQVTEEIKIIYGQIIPVGLGKYKNFERKLQRSKFEKNFTEQSCFRANVIKQSVHNVLVYNI